MKRKNIIYVEDCDIGKGGLFVHNGRAIKTIKENSDDTEDVQYCDENGIVDPASAVMVLKYRNQPMADCAFYYE